MKSSKFFYSFSVCACIAFFLCALPSAAQRQNPLKNNPVIIGAGNQNLLKFKKVLPKEFAGSTRTAYSISPLGIISAAYKNQAADFTIKIMGPGIAEAAQRLFKQIPPKNIGQIKGHKIYFRKLEKSHELAGLTPVDHLILGIGITIDQEKSLDKIKTQILNHFKHFKFEQLPHTWKEAQNISGFINVNGENGPLGGWIFQTTTKGETYVAMGKSDDVMNGDQNRFLLHLAGLRKITKPGIYALSGLDGLQKEKTIPAGLYYINGKNLNYSTSYMDGVSGSLTVKSIAHNTLTATFEIESSDENAGTITAKGKFSIPFALTELEN